jgi:hypothetical protein
MRLFQRLALDKNQRVINSASVTARSIFMHYYQDIIEDISLTIRVNAEPLLTEYRELEINYLLKKLGKKTSNTE